MTRDDLLYVMTGISPECADIEPADEDTAPEPRQLDDETALFEAIALIELLLVREQTRQHDTGLHTTTMTLHQLKTAQNALSQIGRN